MRKNFGAKPYIYPQPVFIIAAYDENGIPNAMNAAWGGISEANELSMCQSALMDQILICMGIFICCHIMHSHACVTCRSPPAHLNFNKFR